MSKTIKGSSNFSARAPVSKADLAPEYRTFKFKAFFHPSPTPPMEDQEFYIKIAKACADAYRSDDHAELRERIDEWLDFTIQTHPEQYGDAVYMDHTYRGLLALDSGDIETARLELLKSGKAPPSPVLKSFGPNLSLGKRMLEAGEKETVLKFLDLCKSFWVLPLRLMHIPRWKKSIEAGEAPNFGGNLFYLMDMPGLEEE